jgi:hypothetical protein
MRTGLLERRDLISTASASMILPAVDTTRSPFLV